MEIIKKIKIIGLISWYFKQKSDKIKITLEIDKGVVEWERIYT